MINGGAEKDQPSKLNKLSTNSALLNICRCSICSPTPMYFTGILNWLAIANTTPPFAVPSSLVIASADTSVAAVNCLACSTAFCPVLPSSTNNTSCGASGIFLPITRHILLSSSIKPALLCRRPAVSIITTSESRAIPLATASKATELGSLPISFFTIGTSTRSLHIVN